MIKEIEAILEGKINKARLKDLEFITKRPNSALTTITLYLQLQILKELKKLNGSFIAGELISTEKDVEKVNDEMEKRFSLKEETEEEAEARVDKEIENAKNKKKLTRK